MQGEGFSGARERVKEQTAQEQLQSKVFELQRQLEVRGRETRAAKGELRELAGALADAERELELYAQPRAEAPAWMTEEREGDVHQGTVVAFLSDTHYGEVVRPVEIGGYNAYDMAIAEARTLRFFDRTIMVARDYLAGVEYDGIVLALGGDLVSGTIHDELTETNEVSTYRAVEECLPWLERGIEMLANEFGVVHVVSAPGNHGRNTPKPRHKKRSENNADTHIARLLAMHLTAPEITFDVPESADVDFELYGHVFSMEHGDNLRFNGTSEIGSLGPVKRGNMRKTTKRQRQGRPFEVGLYGHFHQYVPAYSQGFVMNGSLKGYDEYASDGQFAPEPAQQALFVVTPEHGVTVQAPVIVAKRSAEGW